MNARTTRAMAWVGNYISSHSIKSKLNIFLSKKQNKINTLFYFYTTRACDGLGDDAVPPKFLQAPMFTENVITDIEHVEELKVKNATNILRIVLDCAVAHLVPQLLGNLTTSLVVPYCSGQCSGHPKKLIGPAVCIKRK